MHPRIPQFFPATILYSSIPVPARRYTTKLRSCNTLCACTRHRTRWYLDKKKKKNFKRHSTKRKLYLERDSEFFPRKKEERKKKIFHAFSESGAPFVAPNYPNYTIYILRVARKGRKDNGVIFISVSREKIEKKISAATLG